MRGFCLPRRAFPGLGAPLTHLSNTPRYITRARNKNPHLTQFPTTTPTSAGGDPSFPLCRIYPPPPNPLCTFPVFARFTLPGLLTCSLPAPQHPKSPTSPGMQPGLLKSPDFAQIQFLPLIRTKPNGFKISLKGVLKPVSNTIPQFTTREFQHCYSCCYF